MPLSPTIIQAALSSVPRSQRWWIAYSGGVDSHCLLHILSGLVSDQRIDLAAVHVDHGLHRDSARWVQHCTEVCTQQSIPLRVFCVQARAAPGESQEATARLARYAAFAELLQAGEVLLTAHHQDDQAETILLQLLRGAGSRGLAAMPPLAPFHAGYLARPLLGQTRSDLIAYAQQEHLAWIEDDSNQDSRMDRNYLRHQVLPVLTARWPSAGKTLARAAVHQAESMALLEVLAAQDQRLVAGPSPQTLRVKPLCALSPARARNLLRYWIRTQGHPTPSTAVLGEVIKAAAARWDRKALVTWKDSAIWRHRDLLYLQPNEPH